MRQREAIILDIQGRQAVVLAGDGSFRRIPAPPGARVGQRVQVPVVRAWPRRAALAVAAAVLLALLVPAGLLPVRPAEAVALVSLDLGGSVELAVDSRGRVVGVTTADPELAPVAARVQGLRGRPLAEVVSAAAEAAVAAGLVGPERPLVLAAVPVRDDPKLQAGLRRQLNEVKRQAQKGRRGEKSPSVAAGVVDARVREVAGERGLGLAEAIARVAEQAQVDVEALLEQVERGGDLEELLEAIEELQEDEDDGDGGDRGRHGHREAGASGREDGKGRGHHPEGKGGTSRASDDDDDDDDGRPEGLAGQLPLLSPDPPDDRGDAQGEDREGRDGDRDDNRDEDDDEDDDEEDVDEDDRQDRSRGEDGRRRDGGRRDRRHR